MIGIVAAFLGMLLGIPVVALIWYVMMGMFD